MLGQRPRMVDGCRGGGLDNLFAATVLWGLAVALHEVGDGLEICVDSELVDLTGSSSGNAKVDLVAMSGRRPRIWRNVRGLRAVDWVARATRRLVCAALRLVCGFGAEWCKSGRRP